MFSGNLTYKLSSHLHEVISRSSVQGGKIKTYFILSFLFVSPPLAGHNEGTISVAEGELLYVIEEDKGDGWTRVRRNEDEEGYVPTSYVEVFLETNAKGAMTYI